MTKTPPSTGFQLTPPDPAMVLPTLASSIVGSRARPPAAIERTAGAGGTIGKTRPIPSLIALRGLVGLPDPAIAPDYSALQALVDARSSPVPRLPDVASPSSPAERASASAESSPASPAAEPAPPPPEALSEQHTRDDAATASPPRSTADRPQPRFLESTAAFLGLSHGRFAGLRRVADGNANNSPPPPFAGGLFDTTAGERMVLRKPAPAHDGMNDFVAGMLARVALAQAPWVVPLAFNGGVWLASPQVTGAVDLNDFARAGSADAAPDGAVKRLDSHELTRRVVRAFEQCCGRGLEENVAFAMLVGADEQHSGHFVAMLEPDGQGAQRVRRVVRTDCTSANREHQRLHRIRSNYFDHQMHPAPTPRRLPGFGPNQHRVDVPRDLRCSAPYVEALLTLSRLDLSEAVRLAFLEAAHSWSDDVCRAFAVNANLRLPTRRWTSQALFEACGLAYLQRIEARQKSMQRYAADLVIGLASVDPRSQVLWLNHGPGGEVSIDAFLRQPEIRPSIDAWLRRDAGAARQRNLSLDRHDDALRQAVAQRLAAIDG